MGEPAVPASGGLEDMMGDGVMFESGQRWRTDKSDGAFVLTDVPESGYIKVDREGFYTPDYLFAYGTLLAPAPKPRQRWECDTPYEVQIVDADGDLAVEDYYHGWALCHGTVVEVAKWLTERGYRCVSESISDDARGGSVIKKTSSYAPLRCDGENWHKERSTPTGDIRPLAALASAIAEIWTAPTREVSRGHVDMAVSALPNRRFAGAIKATLVAFSSDRTAYGLRPVDIIAVIDACRTWEHNRAQAPFPNRKLTAAEVKQLIEPTHLAAYARLSWARATIVAHLVADVYERARAAC